MGLSNCLLKLFALFILVRDRIYCDIANCDVKLANGCLFFTASQFSFSDAQLECYKNNGELAILNTTDLVTAVTGLLKQKGINETFIGLTDRIQRGTFRWNDETILTDEGLILHDSIVPPNTEACITQTSNGFWRRSLCNIPSNVLCRSINNFKPNAPRRQWTAWLSLSKPSDSDQILTVESLQKSYPSICPYPVDVQCRVRNTVVPSNQTGNSLQMPCSRNGLICINSHQRNSSLCQYYELRFLCPIDFDECKTNNLNKCDQNSQCSNTFGSYKCVCKPGFSGNGFTCFAVSKCIAWGDPHYVSFDQVTHHFMGICSYRLTETCFHNSTNLDQFNITTANEYRGGSTLVSFAKSVTLNYKNIQIDLRKGNHLLINGTSFDFPQFLTNNNVTIQITYTTKGMRVETSFGLDIVYDGVSRITVSVPKSYSGQLCGMCGNMNGNSLDEWTLSDGSTTTDGLAWGNSWMSSLQNGTDCKSVNNSLPNEMCDSRTDAIVKSKCSQLTSPNGPFKDCQNLVDPQTIYPSCYFDVCSDPQNTDLLCKAYQMYADSCADLGLLLDWRSATGCLMNCGPNQHYEFKTTGCQDSCVNPNAHNNCPHHDTSGCVCNDGFLVSGSTCVPREQCGCIDDRQNYRSIGEEWLTNNCTVKNICAGPGKIVQDPRVQCATYGVCHPLKVIGDYECRCRPGYEGRPDNCTDIDECAQNSHACNDVAHCTNLRGSFNCTCNTGFTGNGYNCMNINECELGTSNCSPYARCFDTYGGFKCVCQNGYDGNGVVCSEPVIPISDNETRLGCTFNEDTTCAQLSECYDKPNGTFICSCIEGTTGDGYRGVNHTGCSYALCPASTYGFNGYCYSFVTSTQSQIDSETLCTNKGAHLATFTSPTSLNFVADKLTIFGQNIPLYVGYSSHKYKDIYMPIDFSLVTFDNWAKNHPIAKNPCVVLLPTNSTEPFKYMSVNCSHAYQAICKFPVSARNCPDGWREVQNKCVSLVEKKIKAIDAALECARYGGDLGTVKSLDESEVLINRIFRLKKGEYWFGFNKNFLQRSSYAQWRDDNNIRYVLSTINLTSPITRTPPDLECYKLLPTLNSISALCINKSDGYLCQRPKNVLSPCPSNSEYFNGRCYKPTTDGPQHNISNSCTTAGGVLVSIETYSEQSFLESYLTLTGAFKNYWIGLKEDLNVASVYKWQDEVPFEYTNWHNNGPSLSGAGNCVIVNASNGVSLPWSESTCQSTYTGLCKYLNTPCTDDKQCNENGNCHMGQCRCNSGFRGDGLHVCNNINECAIYPNLCGANEVCNDTIGNWTCNCANDYIRYYNGACKNKLFCDGDANCANKGKCYNNLCSCNVGFSGDGKLICTDINECDNFNTTDCSINANCINIPGSYYCVCKQGYHGSVNGTHCHLVERNCHEYLMNHPGSLTGMYTLDPDALGPLSPLNVYCEMRPNLGITVIRNDNTSPKNIKGQAPLSEKRPITYEIPLPDILAIISSSNFCYQNMQFKCQGTMNILKTTRYIDVLGVTHAQWGTSNTDNKCGCGEFRTCSNIDSPCFCDGSYTETSYDSGKVIDKTILPILSILTGGNTNYASGAISLGQLNCGPKTFDMPVDCHDAKINYGLAVNDGIWIDVDQDGPLRPFKVMCDVTTKPFGITIIPHDKMPGNYPKTMPDNLPGPLSPQEPNNNQNKSCLSYPTDNEAIKKLISNSGGCTQEVKYDCKNGAKLLNNVAYLETANGVKINYFGSGSNGKCACGVLGTCTNPTSSCNCDGKNDGTDFGFIRDKADLPVTCSVDNNPPSSPSTTSIGPLMCGPGPFGLEPSCHEWLKRGYDVSYAYLVDPDGGNINNASLTNIPEFLVQCIMNPNPPNGVTKIPSDQTPKVCINQTNNLCKVPVTYPLTPEQIKPIIKRSAYCTQRITYKCNIMTLLTPYKSNLNPYAYWRTYGRENVAVNYNYFSGDGTVRVTCDCGLNKTCDRCNCDRSTNVTKIDDGYLTNKLTLPVGAVWIGFDGSVTGLISEVEVGDLECVETFPTCSAYVSGFVATTEKKAVYNTYNSLDPDGPLGYDPIIALCKDGVTIIHPVTGPIKIDDTNSSNIGPDKQCTDIKYLYTPPVPQIKALIIKSASCKQYMKLSCLASPLTNYVTWYDIDGIPRPGWAGNTDGRECACGEVDSCQGGRNYSCNCDSLEHSLTYDHGLIVNKDIIPVSRICLGLTEKVPPVRIRRSVNFVLGPLTCTQVEKEIQPDCQRLRENQYQDQYRNQDPQSEAWVLDPDGMKPGKPFTAYCDMERDLPVGVTIIKPNANQSVCPVNTLSTAPQSINITYLAATQANIQNLKAVSSYCEQVVTYDCENAPLFDGKTFGAYDFNNSYINYWIGPNDRHKCDMNNTCSCSSNPNSQQSDSGRFTDTNRLPLSQIQLPSVSGVRKLCVKELRCYNLPRTCDEYYRQSRLGSSKGNRNNIWAIDPDQSGGEVHFGVLCTTVGPNVITEVLQNPKPLITNVPPVPTRPVPIPYTDGNMNQVHNLVDVSDFCSQRMDYYCTNTGSLNKGGPVITDYLNHSIKAWAGADRYNVSGVCACSILGHCPANESCRCDALSNNQIYEGGLFTNRDILPLQQLTYKSPANSKTKIYSLQCSTSPFSLPVDCTDAWKKGYLNDTEVLIKPVGSTEPFLVFCLMNSGNNNDIQITTISPNLKEVPIQNKITVEYPTATISNIKTLVKVSTYCVQAMKMTCQGIILSSSFQWLDGSSIVRNDFATQNQKEFCPCGQQHVCARVVSDSPSAMNTRQCNCDIQDATIRADSIQITTKSLLPIQAVMFANTNFSTANLISIGPLMCANKKFDVDECKTGFHDCDVNANCTNSNSEYTCQCRQGWQGLGGNEVFSNGRSCIDDNECALNLCPTVSDCFNTPGSFHCECRSGFKKTAPTVCEDINECKLNRSICDTHATCQNTYGSYICVCNLGFRGSGHPGHCDFVSTCSCWGDPHCLSFDGSWLSYQGLCTYTLARDNCANGMPKAGSSPTFVVLIKNWDQNQGYAKQVSWAKEITIKILNYTIVLKLGLIVTVNGQKTSLPFIPKSSDGTDVGIAVSYYGDIVRFTTKSGIEVKWDGNSKVDVTVGINMLRQMCGLCGNFNYNPNDDWIIGPQCKGAGQLTKLLNLFGDSWRTNETDNNSICPQTTCRESPNEVACSADVMTQAQLQCNNLAKIFSACGLAMTSIGNSMQNYIDSCVYDYCHSANDSSVMICKTAESLATRCLEQYKVKVAFRSPNFCAVTCPVNMTYSSCGSACQPSCVNNMSLSLCDSLCVEGCFCKTGYVRQNGRCILPSDCGCTMIDGTYYQDGEKRTNDNCTEICVCHKTTGQLGCVEIKCSDDAFCGFKNDDFSCHCNAGFMGDGIENCTDINECSLTPRVCDVNAHCVNVPGSYTCTCKEGFEGNGVTCSNINECSATPPCDNEIEDCFDEIPGYKCRCKTGFLRNSTNGTCEDKNECLNTGNQCDRVSTNCNNTYGSYRCECKYGFLPNPIDSFVCTDVDECHLVHDCDKQFAKCTNTPGSYYCTCSYGYQGDGINCTDIDECASEKVCQRPDATCVNLPGSYKCLCLDGTPGCDGANPCDNVTCSMTHEICYMGQCFCEPGYDRNSTTNLCNDNDECTTGRNNCADRRAICSNLDGSFECTCLYGYEMSTNGTCQNIDECLQNINRCATNAECVDTNGGYYCQCQMGFTGHCDECRDIDECAIGGNNCDKTYANCNNSIGSYRCECKEGFYGNGSVCEDIDECNSNVNNCTDPNSLCLNSVGTYSCPCLPGYQYDFTGKCTDIDECSFVDNGCDTHADCLNTLSSYTCTCKSGFVGDGKACNPEEGRIICGKSLCPFNSECQNTTCYCKKGFLEFEEDCIDENECNSTTACDVNAQCVNLHGSFKCHCNEGFIGNGLSCQNRTSETDICQYSDYCIDGDCYNGVCHCSAGFIHINDRCFDQRCNSACPSPSICSTSSGSTVCTCPSGTTMSSNASECSDINECAENYDDCQENSLCRNSFGSYQCICPPEYFDVLGDGKICQNPPPSNCNLTCPIGQYCKDDSCTCLQGLNQTMNDGVVTCTKESPSCTYNTCPPDSSCEERLFGFLCHCNPGYQSVGLKSCKDIDECNLNIHNCSIGERCTNIPGSFKCSCKPGYSRVDSSEVCKVTNNCNCEPNGICDRDGKCICNTGYEATTDGNCIDIDECLRSQPCHILADCANTPGSFNCSCPTNFYGDPITRCIEDKCATKQLICPDGQQCVSGLYSSICVKTPCKTNEIMLAGRCVPATTACQSKTCSINSVCKVTNGRADCFCDSGYFGDGDSCTDIDECTKNPTICPTNSRCQNKIGTYHCVCDPGFVKFVDLNSTSEQCSDINECNITGACASNAKCTNFIGSYSCQCKDGYIGDGRYTCQLDSKCQKYGKCATNAKCLLDSVTSNYKCECDSGYSGDGITSCIKDNQCTTDEHVGCHSNATCVLANSTYRCICRSGFQGDGYRFCNDIDECASSTLNSCSPVEKCVNVKGGFKCVCGVGAEIVNDICKDIDECNGTGTSKCSPNAVCNNTNNSHSCKCNEGFYGDGITCIDVDECVLGISNCSSTSKCVNHIGSFDCECQAGKIKNGTICVDVDQCELPKNSTNAAQCDDNANCTKTNTGYTCTCNAGYIGTGWFCVKADPCNKPNVCNINETCKPSDKNEAPICQCKPNFESKNITCVPVKACESNKDTCDKNSEKCVQLEIGFACECLPGFKKVDGSCQDKNECDPNSPDFAAQPCAASGGGCQNTPGSFICTCNEEQAKEGSCKANDPCATNLNNCDKNIENCVNIGNSSYSCQCKPGYQKVNGSCTDINECNDKIDNCKNNATCVNTIGSYNCTCPSTSKLDDSQRSCKDRNECVEDPFICGNNSKCVNTEDSFSCVCIRGYEWNGTNCTDIDECKNLTNPCHEYADCTNIPGACTCHCRPGYNGDGIYKCVESDQCPPTVQVQCIEGTYCKYSNGKASCECKTGYDFINNVSCNDTVCLKQCDDVDECVTKNHACHPLAKCTNNKGAFVCQCPSYLEGDGKTKCIDKDECALGEHKCDLNTSICINNDNTINNIQPFECQCLSGYTKVPGTHLCVNTNECLNPSDNNCDPSAECLDTVGSYECLCKAGYTATPGQKCIDINECVSMTFTCDLHSSCNNTIGSYTCDCHSGYQPSQNSSVICEDINECVNPFACQKISNSECINNAGSFECVCSDGFSLQGGQCIDVDECSNTSSCKNGSICTNVPGNYTCKCPELTRTMPDGSCEDVNECMEGLDQCKEMNGLNSSCYDLPSGYGCVCPTGFVANPSFPIQCQDQDECTLHIDNCSDTSSTCVNKYGSFNCVCKTGYKRTSTGTCIDIDECSVNKDACKHGTCHNTAGGYYCRCDAGFLLMDRHCLDIDECNISPNSYLTNNCDNDKGNCTNTIGGYKCTCRKGYEMFDNTSKCRDINECSYPNSCLNGVCNNIQGSYECICSTGFQLDNGKCIDTDECKQNPMKCGDKSAGVCINTIGSYKCYCSQGYENFGSKITNECIAINECARLNITCPPNAQCLDQKVGYKCVCQDGYKMNQIGICRNVDECQTESSCHYLANCIDTDGSFRCQCKLGFKGDGITTCTAICGPQSCPPNQLCTITSDNQFTCGCTCQGEHCSNSGPVCDTSGVTFNSEMQMFETACKENRTAKVDYFHNCKSSCSKVVCPNSEKCVTISNKPTCICDDCTTNELKPHVLCSNNGIQFQSICQMKKWICETKALITASYDGPCRRPIDCQLSDWSYWSACSRTCGIGQSSRSRIIINSAKFNGKCDFGLKEIQSCYNGPCPGDACENVICTPGSFCDHGNCVCPDCSDIKTTEPVCGKIGDIEAGSYRTFCTLQHNACVYNSSYTYIHSGYCGEYVPSEPKICTVVTDFQFVNNNANCTSVEKVQTNLCSGGCGLNPEYCCRANTSTILRVKFRCLDNSLMFSEVKSIRSCDCKLEATSTLSL